MRHVAVLVMLVVAAGWCLAEVHIAGDSPPHAAAPAGAAAGRRSSDFDSSPQWRRTSEGWVKVGAHGADGLIPRESEPAKPPRLHPGLLSAFLLAAALVSLLWFDRSESEG